MRVFAAALLATVSCVPLSYADEPSHITIVPATPLLRRDVVGIVGHPTIFTFPDDESIYRVPQTATPDKGGALIDAKWEGLAPTDTKDVPLGNNLPLWPVEAGESTMTIITMTKDGKQKVYPLHLIALPDSPDALNRTDVTLNMVYKGSTVRAVPTAPTMPAAHLSPIGARVQPIKAWHASLQRADAEEHIRTDAFNGADGACHYHAQGMRPNGITPLCPMDNGIWTIMRFPGLSQKPAVYSVNADNSDGRLMRQHSNGDFVVIEEIAPRFRLRLGDDVLDIVNDSYDPAGKPTGTGTVAPTVVRDLIRAKAVGNE